MRKLTIEEFNEIDFDVVNIDYAIHEFGKFCPRDFFQDDSYDPEYHYWRSNISGLAFMKSKCGIEFNFSWYARGGSEGYMEMHDFSLGVDMDDGGTWDIVGAEIIDDEGDKVDSEEQVEAIVSAVNGLEWEDAVRKILPKPDAPVDLDIGKGDRDRSDTSNTDAALKRFSLQQNDCSDVQFTGRLLCGVESADDYCESEDDSDASFRWTNLNLYKTKGGEYVCERILHTLFEHEITKHEVEVCHSKNEIIEFFGQGWLAEHLYERQGFANLVETE